MEVKLKHPISQDPMVTDVLLSQAQKEYQRDIVGKPLFKGVRFIDYFLRREHYRKLLKHLEDGGALQSQGGCWRCV